MKPNAVQINYGDINGGKINLYHINLQFEVNKTGNKIFD